MPEQGGYPSNTGGEYAAAVYPNGNSTVPGQVNRRRRTVNHEATDIPASTFAAPKSPVVPSWMEQQPSVTTVPVRRPRIQAAPLPDSSESLANSLTFENPAKVYPVETVGEGSIGDRSFQGIPQNGRNPFSPSPSPQGADAFTWKQRMAEDPRWVRPVPPTAPRPQADTKKRSAPKILSLLLVVSLVVFAAGAGFAGYMFSQNNAYQEQLSQVYSQREEAENQLREAHPLLYRSLITQKAEKYGIVPAFVSSVILNESSFNPLATSSVGARGLMQLMDSTASWIWEKLKIEGDYNFDHLYTESTNVEFGCWYLNYLSKLFNGDPILVAAAFHAGQGEVKNWLNNAKYSSDGVTIPLESLPEGPTKTYVKRILRDYAVYKDYYLENGEESL